MIKGRPSARANCRSKFVTLLFCGVAGLSSTALAQNAVAPTGASAPPASAGSEVPNSSQSAIGDIVVTAQRREQVLSKVPLAVQAATGAQLRSAGITDTRALEQISPALSFQSSYSATSTSLSMRGVTSYSTEGGIQPSVAVVIDGVPTARPSEFISELADIDRIEILAGPQGTLFGKNSTAGVVNIITKRPTHNFEGTMEAMVTTDAQYVVKGVVNLPLSDKIAVRLNGFYDHIDPLIKNRGTGGGIMSQRNYGFQGKILFNFSDDVDLVVTGNYSNLYNSFGPNVVVVPIAGPLGDLQRALYGVEFGRGARTQNLDSPTYNKAYGGSLVAELNARLTDHLKLTSITGYRSVKNRTLTDTDNGPFGVVAGRGYAPGSNAFPLFVVSVGDALNPEDYRYFSEELRATYSSEQFDIVAGGFYQNFKEDRQIRFTYIYDGSYLGLTPGVKYYSQNFNTTEIPDATYAVFGDATYKATPTFNIFGGLRYTKERIGLDWTSTNYFNPVEGFFNPITLENSAPPMSAFAFSSRETVNNLSGRVGAQWLPGNGHNLYATASRGYKGPAIDQSLSTPGDGTSILKPEIATSFEIGAKERLFNGRLALDISLYRTDIKNVQQTSIPPGEITAVLINAGTLKSRGFEVMAQGRVIDGLELSGSVGFVDAHYKGGRFACNATQIPGVAPCDPDGTLSLTGQRAIGTPKWKYILGADAWHNLTSAVLAMARMSYTWHSSNQYSLNNDPLTREPSVGLLNASIGLKAKDGKWEAELFANNITNHFYYNHLGWQPGFLRRPLDRQYASRFQAIRRFARKPELLTANRA